jgi:peptidoglycan/xylan/chitin deacetylase (PgdA/CDA1 family)
MKGLVILLASVCAQISVKLNLHRVFSARNKGLILTYHSILNDESIPASIKDRLGNLTVTEGSFYKQIQYLSNNFELVTLQEILKNPVGHSDRPRVTITFDDGYLDNLTVALPILKEFNCPASIFVTKDFCQGHSLPWWLANKNELDALSAVPTQKISNHKRELLLLKQTHLLKNLQRDLAKQHKIKLFLSELDIRLLLKENIAIYPHSVSHPCFSFLSDAELKDEIHGSINWVKSLGGSVDSFALPYGGADHTNASVHKIFQDMQSLRPNLLATTSGFVGNDECINRINIHGLDTQSTFILKVHGMTARMGWRL